MKKKVNKLYIQTKKRFLKKIIGTTNCPRLAIFRSHKHIYAQLIDDQTGTTLTASSTLDRKIKEKFGNKTATQEASKAVGEQIGLQAREKGVNIIVFDRGVRPYHGRVAKVAEGARLSGLVF